jgi:DNA invertase Pin-like site-specific DNA recombinase
MSTSPSTPKRRQLAQRAADGDVEAGRELGKLMLQTRDGAPRKAVDVAQAKARLANGESKEAVALAFKVSVRTLDRRLGGK